MANAAFKPDKDFTKEVDQQIPQAELLAKVNRDYKKTMRAECPDIQFRFRTTFKGPSNSSPCSRSKHAR
jgi:hypothetical protein